MLSIGILMISLDKFSSSADSPDLLMFLQPICGLHLSLPQT